MDIACSLGPSEGAQRMADWQRVLTEHCLGADRTDTSILLRFRADSPPDPAADATLGATLRRLVDAERECCGFLDWDLSASGPEGSDEWQLRISGTPEGLQALTLAAEGQEIQGPSR